MLLWLVPAVVMACSDEPVSGSAAFAFSWAIYNRTVATVAVGPSLGVAPCGSVRLAGDQTPGPDSTIVPGAIPVSGLSFVTPPGYTGVVTVVVTSDGRRVTIGEIDAASLPACQGQPKP
jgi:hypothetical protein